MKKKKGGSNLLMLFSYCSWAQRKLSSLSPLNPLNILLSINGPLLSYGFNGLKRLTDPVNKNLTINAFNGLKKFNETRHRRSSKSLCCCPPPPPSLNLSLLISVAVPAQPALFCCQHLRPLTRPDCQQMYIHLHPLTHMVPVAVRARPALSCCLHLGPRAY